MYKSEGVIHTLFFSHIRMLFRYCIAFLIVMVLYLESYAQPPALPSPEKKFVGEAPLWNWQHLSGNFGELRGNHFHSGFDYKTNEMEGLPVMAADDGYISRVKISSAGYGKAIYVTHPGGIVTVYGHLRRLYISLQDSISNLQVSKQQYEVEIFPKPDEFPVGKGQVIGFSGNTGSSSGPHLHFETRHEGSEVPFNPVIAGFQINDTVSPVISSLVIYEPGPYGSLFGSSRHILEKETGKDLLISDTVYVQNNFFTGIEGYDLAGDDRNHIGIRTGKLYLDDSLVFSFAVDSFSFSQTRLVQSFFDYGFYMETGRKVILFYVLDGNKLPLYKSGSKGILKAAENKFYNIRIEVEDASGNRSVRGCVISRVKKTTENNSGPQPSFLPGKSSVIRLKHAKIEVPASSFYEAVNMTVEELEDCPSRMKCFSPVIKLSPDDLPVNEALTISLKCSFKGISDRSKLAVARVSSGSKSYVSGTLHKKTMQFRARTMGNYVVTWDTVPPRCEIPRWEADNFTGTAKLFIPVEDNFTGIRNYSCFMNNTWVPAAYNSSRNGIIIYPEDFPENAVPGSIRIEVEDEVANKSRFEFPLTPSKFRD